MALCRINPRRKPLLLVPRPFSSSSSSSNPPFPPPPPPSNDSSSPPPPPPPHDAPRPAGSSLFMDIRERLRSSPAPPPSGRMPPARSSPPGHAASPVRSLEDIKRSLESFHGLQSTRGAAALSSAGGATPSFQSLLRNNPAQAPPRFPNAGANSLGFDVIKSSLNKLGDPMRQPSRAPFLSPTKHDIFQKELSQKAGKSQGAGKEEGDSGVMLARSYTVEELGEKLRELRPAAAGKDGKEWFSLEELQGRIAKLAKLEMNEPDTRLRGSFSELRESIDKLKKEKETETKNKTFLNMAMLSSIGMHPMQEYMRFPPQEELLERYFHPDHMSSEEKMKLELQKVRDEFKMSENDCGSARVQIAQLTLKIKHLSAVLHKKDKHSRKGLQEMVQRRKKYLKYLRRTDWDSYCLVLSKLGLRDTPEYKAPDYKKTQSTTKTKSKKSKSKRKKKMKA